MKAEIARVAEIALRRAHADGLAALAVQVAPIAPQRRRRRPRASGLARAISSPFAMSRSSRSPAVVGDEILDDTRTVAGLDRDALRQAAQRPRRHERKTLIGVRGRVAPHVLGDDGEAERLADHRERGPDRLPARRRTGHQIEPGLLGQLAEFISREGIDRGLELDVLLDIGLQAIAGRALPAVAETYGQRVAGAQIAAADANEQRVGVWPDVEAVEPDFELGAVARLDRGEVRRGGLVELRLAHIGGCPPRDLHHPGIVDAERARGVDERQLGVRARDKRARTA